MMVSSCGGVGMCEGSFVGKDESEEERTSQIYIALYPKTAPQQLHSNQTSETTSINGQLLHYLERIQRYCRGEREDNAGVAVLQFPSASIARTHSGADWAAVKDLATQTSGHGNRKRTCQLAEL
jgi:hypothetical protein